MTNQPQLPALADGETYIGAIGDKIGDAYHLVLLADDNDPAPQAAQLEWAKSVGGDLPDKLEAAMLFAHAKGEFKPDWYWASETFIDPYAPEDAGWAWCQDFDTGRQRGYHKNTKFRARYVRRVPVELEAEVERLKGDLETERMRLAACGTIALANTPESAAKSRAMLEKYSSASVHDVARAVDAEMAARAEIARLRKDAERLDYLDTVCSNGNGARLFCLPGGLRAAIDSKLAEKVRP